MKDLLRPRPAVRWLPWAAAAFDRAREEQKTILLSVSAAWSRACQEMDDQCYADPSVAEEVNRWFVPVRVDADRRPDVAERYDLGGLPSTAFLTNGGHILGGGTFVPKDRLLDALRRLRSSPLSGLAATTPNFQPPASNANEGSKDSEELIRVVFDSFDREHAGFGTAPKFPLGAPVRLALDLFDERGDAAVGDCATRTLDAMGWGALYDHDEGGFFRCCARGDWEEPAEEKLLGPNALLLDLYLEAGVRMQNQRWLERAADVLEYVQSKLADAPGDGWRTSEASDGARLSDANAQMVSSALRAAAVFKDDSLRELALLSAETVLLSSYRPGQGVAHCAGGVRGLTTDQFSTAAACLDAWDATGSVPYQMMAQELAQYALRSAWDEASGGFFDRALSVDEDLGLEQRRLKPFVLNCVAAEVLHRLGREVDDGDLTRRASLTLDAIAAEAASQGPLAAHYVLARRSLSR